MPLVEWRMQGVEFLNCNCNWGCPCQFNSLPTHGHCRAYSFVQVDRGQFGNVPLDGIRWGVFAAWPGPIHKGDGRFQVVVDERADQAQRAAIEAVAQGRETDPGTLIWQVFSTTFSSVLPTIFAPIALQIDIDARTAHVSIPGIIEGSGEPIRNPVTDRPHRARISLPAGFEYSEAEVMSGSGKTTTAIELDFTNTHAHVSRIHWSTHGVVR